MTLDEWDKQVAPILNAMEGRARTIKRDCEQIMQWVKEIPVVPGFESRAEGSMRAAKTSLSNAEADLIEAIDLFHQKEKVK